MSHRSLYRKHNSDLSTDDRKDAPSIIPDDEEDDDHSIIMKSAYSDEENQSSDKDSVDLHVLERGSSAEQLESSIHQAIKRTIKRFSNSSIKEEEDEKMRKDLEDQDTDDASDHENVIPNGYHKKRELLVDSSDEDLDKNKENIENSSSHATSSVEDGSSQKSSTPLIRRIMRKRRIVDKSNSSDNETPVKRTKSELSSFSKSPEYALRRTSIVEHKKPDTNYSDESEQPFKDEPVHYISKAGSSKESLPKPYRSTRPDDSKNKKKEFLKKAVEARRKSYDTSDDSDDEKTGLAEKTVIAKRKSYNSSSDSDNAEKGSEKKPVLAMRKSYHSDNNKDGFQKQPALALRKSYHSDNNKDGFQKQPALAMRKAYYSDNKKDGFQKNPALAMRKAYYSDNKKDGFQKKPVLAIRKSYHSDNNKDGFQKKPALAMRKAYYSDNKKDGFQKKPVLAIRKSYYSENTKDGFQKIAAIAKKKTDDSMDDSDDEKNEFPKKAVKVENESNGSSDNSDNKGLQKNVTLSKERTYHSTLDCDDEKKEFQQKDVKVKRKFVDSSDDTDNDEIELKKKALKVEKSFNESSDEIVNVINNGMRKKTVKVENESGKSSDDSDNEKEELQKKVVLAKRRTYHSTSDCDDEKKGFQTKAIKVENKFEGSSDDADNEKRGFQKKPVKAEKKFDESSDDAEDVKKESVTKNFKAERKSEDSSDDSEYGKKVCAKKCVKVEDKSDDSANDSDDEKEGFLQKSAEVASKFRDSSDDEMDNSASPSEMSVSYVDSDRYKDTSSEASVTSDDDSNESDYRPDDYEDRKTKFLNHKLQIERNLATTKILLRTANEAANSEEARRYQRTIDAEEKKLAEIKQTMENLDQEKWWDKLYYTAPKKAPAKDGHLFKNNSSEMDPAYLTPKLEDVAKKLGKQAQATLNREQSLTVERLHDLHGSLLARPVENQKAQDPKGLKVPLMPHQQHALAWLQWREGQNPRGGVLADEMGLGKTLTMIALVMASIAKDNEGDASENEDEWKTSARGQRHLGGTLVVVPASLLSQWDGEVKTRCKRNSIKVEVYHGAKRETAPRRLAKNDIVLTTYNIVCREFKMWSLLFKIHWRRVILDEAHVIRNHKSQPCESVCALHTNKRWAVTGTPLHNKEMDLYSLLKFLRCSPFDDVRVWKRWVDNKNDAGHVRLATVMKTLMLRRTKQELQEKGELPPLPQKTVKTIEVALDPEERLVYDKVMLYSRTLFGQFLTQRAEKAARAFEFGGGGGYERLAWNYRGQTFTKKQNKLLSLHADVQAHEILVLLIRLRQVCCHPSLIEAMLDRDDIELQAGTDLFPEVNQTKKLKKEDDTLKDELDDEDDQDFAVDERVAEHLLTSENPVFAADRTSSKMRAIISKVEEVIDQNDKIIVVSQWVGVLNIVARELDLISGASYRMFTGKVAVKDRQKIIDDFNSKRKHPNVLLLSLTGGGVGLNIVGANHMLLVDIHWNPQLEAQAQDRIHRFGQTKEVTIYKYICSDTIEERIQALQNKKLELARQILTGTGKVVGSKLSLDDIKSLFGV